MHGLVAMYFPQIRLIDDLKKISLPPPPPPADSYACYHLSAWKSSPCAATADMRITPMNFLGFTILDTPKIRRPSKIIYAPTAPRSIDQKYVCIGVQASSNIKCWLNPDGWERVVDYLKSLGYRVLCIDRDRRCENSGLTVEIPRGAEDFSGDYDLIDRVNQLAYADFYIGVSSLLAWLAWSVDIPVVLISGMTEPWFEFDTPYRVRNPLTCRGCLNYRPNNSVRVLQCYKRNDIDNRKFECSKNISARQVINAIDRLIADENLSDGSDLR